MTVQIFHFNSLHVAHNAIFKNICRINLIKDGESLLGLDYGVAQEINPHNYLFWHTYQKINSGLSSGLQLLWNFPTAVIFGGGLLS